MGFAGCSGLGLQSRLPRLRLRLRPRTAACVRSPNEPARHAFGNGHQLDWQGGVIGTLNPRAMWKWGLTTPALGPEVLRVNSR